MGPIPPAQEEKQMAMAFDPNRWTLRTQEAVQAAVEMARTQAHPEVTPDHLLAALVGQQEGVVLPILGKVGVAPLSLRNRAGEALARLPKAHGGQPPQLSRGLRAAMEAAAAAPTGLHAENPAAEDRLLAAR